MAAVTVIWSEYIFDSVGDKGIGTVRYCGFLAFIIEENAKFQLEVSEKITHLFSPSKLIYLLNSKRGPFGGCCKCKFKNLL